MPVKLVKYQIVFASGVVLCVVSHFMASASRASAKRERVRHESRVSSCGNRENGVPPGVLPPVPYSDMRRW